ncbi:DUF2750 domain-containing protein [Chryseobacterium potabilaquae]|uniref:DUF2750 domain-containing protein n=1 Tax=Chryseobacterium potabilaquae TaxID=2675057 RepID=A0A6N4XBD0_9FLAO|nr:DUF2750 domain-containing protein [Chryseobacterium potabilaquae]CAA7196727.1 hypothetical protein CHRY9293_02802 [Chryseobacterium potabilaquae]
MEDTNKKIANILKMTEDERYDYFIRKVTDFEEIWGLSDDGWALLGDDNGNQILPLWPEKEFAKLCAIDQWKDYKPESIELDNFIEKWIPGMINDKTLVNIFLTPDAKGTVINPNDLYSDLQEELEQYE